MTKDAFALEVKQSAGLLRYLMVIHGLFLTSIALMPITRHWQNLLFVILILSFIHYYQSHYKKTGRNTVSQLMLSEGWWSVDFGDGSRVEDLSLRQSFVQPSLVILYFKPSSGWRTTPVYLLADQVDAKQLRQLRVYCRVPKTYQQ